MTFQRLIFGLAAFFFLSYFLPNRPNERKLGTVLTRAGGLLFAFGFRVSARFPQLQLGFQLVHPRRVAREQLKRQLPKLGHQGIQEDRRDPADVEASQQHGRPLQNALKSDDANVVRKV